MEVFLEMLQGSDVIFGLNAVCRSYLFPSLLACIFASASPTDIILDICWLSVLDESVLKKVSVVYLFAYLKPEDF